MDPLYKEDGTPVGPEKYKQIVKERYYITKHSNTSYMDTGKITPTERGYLVEFISEDLKKAQELLDQAAADSQKIKRRR